MGDKQERTSTARKCKSKRKDGQPCGAWACSGSDFCFIHDPKKARERHRARQRGGYARHGRKVGKVGDPEPVAISTVGDVVRLLERAVNDALTLENSIQRARAIGYLAGVILKGLEVSELEQRLARLEELVP